MPLELIGDDYVIVEGCPCCTQNSDYDGFKVLMQSVSDLFGLTVIYNGDFFSPKVPFDMAFLESDPFARDLFEAYIENDFRSLIKEYGQGLDQFGERSTLTIPGIHQVDTELFKRGFLLPYDTGDFHVDKARAYIYLKIRDYRGEPVPLDFEDHLKVRFH